MAAPRNKRKIFNDPVYGFIGIHNDLLFDIIEHPYFQRLRRIKQLGLTHLVYPGALHTRFHHSMGAMHLMTKALLELQYKGHELSEEEVFGAQAAMLLHDIGHGPYSHALENSMVNGINHENISQLFLSQLNGFFNGELELAIDIFNQNYHKSYLSELCSGQFDMDRLDYLKRDSFFTGVSEGVINYERLLNMINLRDGSLVIEAKGIYSVEKFITARRLMYWQVYLHKTVVAAEFMIMKLLKRAKEIRADDKQLFATPALDFFLRDEVTEEAFTHDPQVLQHFALLDDYDVFTSMKMWCTHPDKVLSKLSASIVNRRLFKVEMQNHPFTEDYLATLHQKTKRTYGISEREASYLCFHDKTTNAAYRAGSHHIKILFKDGSVRDIAEATDELNINLLSKPQTKYFVCYPKDIS